MIVALTGFMASGKTTFGRAAAERLGWAFVDLDERITEQHGTPATLFAKYGEARFREIETAVLGETLAEAQGDTVLALGGGTVLREDNLRLIKQHATLIWLDTDYDIILSELGNADRPVLHGRTPAQIRALYDERRPLYAAAADITFPITATDYNQVITDLAELLRTLKSPTLI
ncbi:MAG: shikimate kinase [Bacteroidales bacterium]|nr:shikimate kinase [Bacteroidales bacterium]